jgi:hypothetical protein
MSQRPLGVKVVQRREDPWIDATMQSGSSSGQRGHPV